MGSIGFHEMRGKPIAQVHSDICAATMDHIANTFMGGLKQEALNGCNVAYTENGAKMFGTTGKALLDLNFSLSSLRNSSPEEIIEKFMVAANEDYVLALKWLFYARDVREGMGERYVSRTIFKYLAKEHYMSIRHLVALIPTYGRWDDMIDFFGTPLEGDVLHLIASQWHCDQVAMKYSKPASLMAKWLPSINSSSADSRRLALKIVRYLGISIASYRKILSKLRKYLDVVEIKMSAGQWGDIDYSRVPSRANMIYSKAFLRHDYERRSKFLENVIKGEEKINSGMVYPHEIIYRITCGYANNPMDILAMWEGLPRPEEIVGRTLVVGDGSGSMKARVSDSSGVRRIDVCYALAIYFSELLKGPYKNRMITFSEHPQFVELGNCNSIFEKVEVLRRYTEVANTNIEAVFDLILKTAIDGHLQQDDLPDNILVISDMEFDGCVVGNDGDLNLNLFEEIARRYNEAGYKLPRVCFWNTAGHSGAIPVIENELGVALMSGFSVNNIKLIMSGKTDPYEALVDILMSDRYASIYPAFPD